MQTCVCVCAFARVYRSAHQGPYLCWGNDVLHIIPPLVFSRGLRANREKACSLWECVRGPTALF